ncbi:hypothetical protein SFC43_11010 [Bacteroides sp. CR5/BHMF/2]|nr:hypothetical protein [Bacteroides sp. CR5/BHMF/2]
MYGSESVPKEAAQNWNLIDKNSYLIGDFVWTALDYLGEAGLAHTSNLLRENTVRSLWDGRGIMHGVVTLTSAETRNRNLIIATFFGKDVIFH